MRLARAKWPDFGPKWPNIRPVRPDLRFWKPDLRPVLRPERPDLGPERPDRGGGKRTNEQTNKQTKVPLYSAGFHPLWGCCSKNVKKFIF